MASNTIVEQAKPTYKRLRTVEGLLPDVRLPQAHSDRRLLFLSLTDFKDVLKNIDHVLLDCDGVVWLEVSLSHLSSDLS